MLNIVLLGWVLAKCPFSVNYIPHAPRLHGWGEGGGWAM
jgi:hypothetical protein